MNVASQAIHVSEATFQAEVIERSRRVPVLVDFWAPWCGPCRTLSPILDRIAAESDGAFVLAKVNTDENPDLAAQYDIRSIPVVKMFRNGRVVDEFVGVKPEREVRDFVKEFAPTQIDRWLMEAASLVYGQRWDEAAAAYRKVLASHPGHPQAALELGRLYLSVGKGDEAEAALREVPIDAAERAAVERLLPLARLIKYGQTSNGAPEGLDAEYWQAGRDVREHRITHAIEILLGILRKNRNYRDGEARGALLGLLDHLGEDPVAKDYRRQLANVLF